MAKQHLSVRIDKRTVARLDRRARELAEYRSTLAARYIEEGLRMDAHPGIVFRPGPAGRRAGVAGTGLDVWEVVGSVQASGGNEREAAAYLEVGLGKVQAAIGYYAEFPEEIDDWLARIDSAAKGERLGRREASA